MKTPTTNAIEYYTRPYTKAGFQIDSIQNGRITLKRHIRQRGSILVLVVVLLVLLALMGTAYLSTTRTDRYAAEQNRANTQMKLNTDAGVLSVVEAQIVADSPFVNTAAKTWDCATNNTVDQDLFLAERIPDFYATAPVYPYWSTISWPLLQTGGAYVFNSPFAAATFTLTQPKNGYWFQPSFDATTGMPTLAVRDAVAPNAILQTIPAADTDDDGIADAGLVKLPQQQNDGLTYYAAVRVIDNNAAVNVNTAWSRVWEFDYQGNATPINAPVASYQGFFPTQVGLLELLGDLSDGTPAPDALDPGATVTINNQTTGALPRLSGNTTSRALFNYRVGLDLLPTNPVTDLNLGVVGPGQHPTMDDGSAAATAPNPDFVFVTMGDMLSSQLVRRIDNPGLMRKTDPPPASTHHLRAFSLADDLSLARRFALSDSAVSRTTMEEVFANSIATGTPPSYSVATDVLKWYDDNFNFGDTGAGTKPVWGIRSFLVGHNPTASRVREHPVPTGMTAGTIPTPKTNINNAAFADLHRAFFNAMCKSDIAAPTPPDNTVDRVFNNPVRGTGPVISQVNMMLIRSAVAAANAEDLRARSIIPTSHNITLLSDVRTVTVYGNVPQPFITEVLTDSNGAGTNYLAVELYNPTTVTIDISGWVFAQYDRLAGTLTQRFVVPSPTTIGNGAYLVFSSNGAGPTTPPAIVVTATAAPTIDTALGSELILLRSLPAAPAGLDNMAPVDQIDLAGVPLGAIAGRRTYQRSTAAGQAPWPGQWTAAAGMEGMKDQVVSSPPTLGALNATPTITQIATIQLADPAWPSFNNLAAPLPYRAPFGQFGRLGDILQVPFIGSYTVRSATAGNVDEILSISADAQRSEPTAPALNTCIGRFLNSGPGYEWTGQVFDYLAVSTPADDYMPDNIKIAGMQAVANGPILNPVQANVNNEKLVPVHGLINVNTAPWRVLSALPMIPPYRITQTAGEYDYIRENNVIAKAVLAQRKIAPYARLADLNSIAAFKNPQNGAGTNVIPANPDVTWGDYSPLLAPDLVTAADDFERQALMLTRIGNFITTRSDSYTVYIVIQGWRDAETAGASMEVERRAAFWLDRSGVFRDPTNANNRNLKANVIPIPQ